MAGDQPQHVGRDELAAMLGANRASDMIAAAGTSIDELHKAKKSSSSGQGPRGGKEDEDVSKLDRAQAAALVARKFAGGSQTTSARHRAAGKRKRDYHLLASDLLLEQQSKTKTNHDKISNENVDIALPCQAGHPGDDDDSFGMRAARKKSEAKILVRNKGGATKSAKRRGDTSDESSSDSDASSSDDSSQDRRRRRRNSSSSSSSDDEADRRRARARHNREAKLNLNDHRETPDQDETRPEGGDENNDVKTFVKPVVKADNEMALEIANKSPIGHKGSSSGSSSSNSSSSDSSETSSSSDDEPEEPIQVAKPLFVPKSKRGTVTEVEAQQQKMAAAEERRAKEREKRVTQSRALVAEAASAAGNRGNDDSEDGDEFTGESGDFISVPDDSDPAEEGSSALQAEKDAWEVRELVRILRDIDVALEAEKERKELARRRALTDEERLEEDKRLGRYRAPGEARRRQHDVDKDGEKNNYLQRYHHRGAFYLDEDTLNEAGADDVRHRAAEYSRAATGEDKVDKSALPEVMQVKKFGFAGYSTKYKGLSKEDTTDKSLDCLPIMGKSKGKRTGDPGQRYRDHRR